jgi:hypothetical protein
VLETFRYCGSAVYACPKKRSIGAAFDLDQTIPILRNVNPSSGQKSPGRRANSCQSLAVLFGTAIGN